MSNSEQTANTDRHQQKMQKHKEKVDAAIARAQEERGVIIVLTGNGKGKSSSGFGTVIRTLGHGYKAGLVQFIKGTWDCGEAKILATLPGLTHEVMGSGFTWETQNKEQDQRAFDAVWPKAKAMLSNPELRTVMLDEITYMLAYDLLDFDELKTMYSNSLKEFYRILCLDGIVIFKCQDVVSGGLNLFSHCWIMYEAIKHGFYPKDLFILLAKNRITDGRKQQHARKFHSYFWVFKKTKCKVDYKSFFEVREVKNETKPLQEVRTGAEGLV
ncbi:MAG: cob(I)yrinic acid a,c-diamide adenosyltransferase, partial [Gammaproteobacteria bacterium]|nr:cob(I)yrinic acid a,c-diamide adenosyltransferase [Gammaproteobacteria bacterium]